MWHAVKAILFNNLLIPHRQRLSKQLVLWGSHNLTVIVSKVLAESWLNLLKRWENSTRADIERERDSRGLLCIGKMLFSLSNGRSHYSRKNCKFSGRQASVDITFTVGARAAVCPLLDVCHALIKVWQWNSVFLIDLPLNICFQYRPLIVWKCHWEQCLWVTYKLVDISLPSNLQPYDR